jgi:hypothetical protein
MVHNPPLTCRKRVRTLLTARMVYAFWASMSVGTMWTSPRGLAVISGVDTVKKSGSKSLYVIRYKLFAEWGKDAWT